MAAQYHLDQAGFDEHVLCAPWMIAEMAKRAEKVKARAEITAPFDPNSKDGTHYRDAFEVSSGIREGIEFSRTGRRAYGRVTNTDAAAIYVEYGNGHTPRHRTLGNALDAAGD